MRRLRMRSVPGDGLTLQESDRVANGYCGAGSGRGRCGRLGNGESAGAQPAAFDEANHGSRTLREDRGTTLTEIHRMAAEKNLGGLSSLFRLCRLIGEHFARAACISRTSEHLGVPP